MATISLAVVVAHLAMQLMHTLTAQVVDPPAATSPLVTSPPVTSPASAEDKILVPGKGFKEETAQPKVAGDGPYHDAKAIARWDVVPYQTFENKLNLGVVAFHIKGIMKVSFSADGGPWKDVTSMTLNPETNVVEYWVTLQASDFPDGISELRAIVYPNTGVARVLAGKIPFRTGVNETTTNGEHSIWLFPNHGKTLKRPEIFVRPSTGNDSNPGTAAAPVATLRKALSLTSSNDGARIVLTEAGSYKPDQDKDPVISNNRWVTVEPGVGLSRDQVSIVGTGEDDRILPKVARLEWKNLTFRPDTYAYINEGNAQRGAFEWYNNCLLTSAVLTPGDVPQWRSNVYATDSRVENSTYGFVFGQLIRNCAVKDALDAYQGSQLVLNCKVERMRASALGVQHHPDVYQTWGAMKNVIVYGLTGDDIDGAQVLFVNQPIVAGPDMTDAAFVNWDVKTYDKKGGPPFSQFQGRFNNILLKNVQIPNQRVAFRAEVQGLNHFEGKNVELQECQFYNTFKTKEIPPGVTIKKLIKLPVQPRSKGYPSSSPESDPAVPAGGKS